MSFVRQSSPQDTPPKIFINDVELIDYDIYRGDLTPTPQTSRPESVASQRSFSTVSTDSFRLSGGRIGTLATHLERAITRWARKNGADSSSSLNSDTSSSSSRSSFRTANKSTRRKRRPPSLADIQHRVQSERAVAARIRARELRRTVPREFNLYIPPLCSSQEVGPIQEEEQVVRTFSLDAILPHLESVLRKPRRSRHRARRAELDQPHHSHPLRPQEGRSAEDEPGNASGADASDGTSHKEGKGKHRLSSTAPPPSPPQATFTPQIDPDAGKPSQAWWLDVASPSWEDLRTLGRVSAPSLLVGTQAKLRHSYYIFTP
jgi:magnesium transporter